MGYPQDVIVSVLEEITLDICPEARFHEDSMYYFMTYRGKAIWEVKRYQKGANLAVAPLQGAFYQDGDFTGRRNIGQRRAYLTHKFKINDPPDIVHAKRLIRRSLVAILGYTDYD